MKFFISRLSSLGDVVCTLPAASALKAAFPDCEITWAVSSKFADIVSGSSSVDKVIPIVKGVKFAKPDQFEAAFDLQGLLKSAILLQRVKAKQKLGYHWQREGAGLFSSAVLPDKSSIHVVDQYVDVVRAAGGIADRADFALVADPAAVDEMKPQVPDSFVVINPGAAWISKRWPPKHVATLTDALFNHGYKAVLIGGKGETAADEASHLATSPPINLSGKTNLKQLVALVSLAKAHIGGDTGSTHIAAALDVPAIGLYSSTKLERSCPYGQIDRCIFDERGLAHIQPSAVLDKVLEAIA